MLPSLHPGSAPGSVVEQITCVYLITVLNVPRFQDLGENEFQFKKYRCWLASCKQLLQYCYSYALPKHSKMVAYYCLQLHMYVHVETVQF